MTAEAATRVAWIDHARGIALGAMVVYHFSFDLALLGLVDWNVSHGTFWRSFAIAIAGSFIALAGVSLSLAARGGLRWRSYLRRLAILAAAALGVTVATSLTMPYPIWFGILHAIALFSVLALPFLRLHPAVTLVSAVAVLIAPIVLTSEIFAHPLLYPLGLSPNTPPSMDYEPIFPWFAPMLVGIAVARYLQMPRTAPATDLLARAGRHSLLIYLAHQPILLVVLLGLRQLGLV
ncbi:heparan-alpha-glucosaminide N-acetyltransferase [Palleronia caenipelagi]|uniref:DUF1624 domain-containing protein n=1 Tax=Palleronia caenipelagi TaxID=2489174 RepID=A0A547Q581_9RHOB|nr:heparan-alpha-glucosaminide N-acetyltransferase [Palleronia caenipelagi]TRD21546.1 DUF1624 domain-containing protein [Palleronia caenipelagi]